MVDRATDCLQESPKGRCAECGCESSTDVRDPTDSPTKGERRIRGRSRTRMAEADCHPRRPRRGWRSPEGHGDPLGDIGTAPWLDTLTELDFGGHGLSGLQRWDRLHEDRPIVNNVYIRDGEVRWRRDVNEEAPATPAPSRKGTRGRRFRNTASREGPQGKSDTQGPRGPERDRRTGPQGVAGVTNGPHMVLVFAGDRPVAREPAESVVADARRDPAAPLDRAERSAGHPFPPFEVPSAAICDIRSVMAVAPGGYAQLSIASLDPDYPNRVGALGGTEVCCAVPETGTYSVRYRVVWSAGPGGYRAADIVAAAATPPLGAGRGGEAARPSGARGDNADAGEKGVGLRLGVLATSGEVAAEEGRGSEASVIYLGRLSVGDSLRFHLFQSSGVTLGAVCSLCVRLVGP